MPDSFVPAGMDESEPADSEHLFHHQEERNRIVNNSVSQHVPPTALPISRAISPLHSRARQPAKPKSFVQLCFQKRTHERPIPGLCTIHYTSERRENNTSLSSAIQFRNQGHDGHHRLHTTLCVFDHSRIATVFLWEHLPLFRWPINTEAPCTKSLARLLDLLCVRCTNCFLHRDCPDLLHGALLSRASISTPLSLSFSSPPLHCSEAHRVEKTALSINSAWIISGRSFSHRVLLTCPTGFTMTST